jgi:hypothetical protein
LSQGALALRTHLPSSGARLKPRVKHSW